MLMSFDRYLTNVDSFTQPFSLRFNLQEVPCETVTRLEREHAQLSDSYQRTVRRVKDYIEESTPHQTCRATTFCGALVATPTTVVVALTNPLAGVATAIISFALSYKLGKWIGREGAECDMLPLLKQDFETEVNWIRSVYPEIESKLAEISKYLAAQPTPTMESTVIKMQYLAVKTSFDLIIQEHALNLAFHTKKSEVTYIGYKPTVQVSANN